MKNFICLTILIFFYCKFTCAQNFNWKIKDIPIKTQWADQVDTINVLNEYPRPQMQRSSWTNLNGLWDYAISDTFTTLPIKYEGKILVPFPVESALSGVKKDLQPNQFLWYRRNFRIEKDISKHTLLHFGAIDWNSTVYINGKFVGSHLGGYQNISFDITPFLKDGENELSVKVYDPTDKGPNPHGKQVLKPSGIMYTATSGIWQTVWLEKVPRVYINAIKLEPNIDKQHLTVKIQTNIQKEGYTIRAVASNGETINSSPNLNFEIPVKNPRLWSPDDPFLYDLTVELIYNGKVVDTVKSYFGMRKIEIATDAQGIERLFLNNKYLYHLGVLDQGFWPEGLYTAPTDEALKFDIEAIKAMGFNTIRKHIKIEPARWYYHCDKLGMLVWQDMVTCANLKPESKLQFEKENQENINQLFNSPSIVLWVVFNEGWARYDQKRITELIKNMDSSRIVDGHSGENYDGGSPQNLNEKWISSDLTDVHEYPGPGISPKIKGKAQVLGEWGGVRVVTPNHQWNSDDGWGYIDVNASNFQRKYELMIKHLKIYEEEGLSGSIYTEPFDVETEENGLITYDRKIIKILPQKLLSINSLLYKSSNSSHDLFEKMNVAVADTSSLLSRYSVLLRKYQSGARDSSFLKEILQTAISINDTTRIATFTSDFLSVLKNPYEKKNLQYILQITKNTKDKGFTFLRSDFRNFANNVGRTRAKSLLMNLIYTSDIDGTISNVENFEKWDELTALMTLRYDSLGREMSFRAKTMYYLNNPNDSLFIQSAINYLEDYGNQITAYDLNNICWEIFKRTDKKQFLQVALKWSKYTLDVEKVPVNMDTYANLLYKLGQVDSAIKYQEDVIKLESDTERKKGFIQTLQKMRKGEITWN